jgi:hypothetical protein
MSTRILLRGKDGRCVRLTTHHLHVPNVKKIRGLNLPDPHGPVQACSGTALPLLYSLNPWPNVDPQTVYSKSSFLILLSGSRLQTVFQDTVAFCTPVQFVVHWTFHIHVLSWWMYCSTICRHSVYVGVEAYLHSLLTSTLYGRQWSALRCGRFTIWVRAPGTHLVGGWLGPRAGLEVLENRNISCPCRESKHDISVVQRVV